MADIASAEVCDDLLTVLKLDRKPDESAADFTERVIKRAEKCPEKQWEALQEPTQEWVNAWLQLNEDPAAELPLLVAEDGETEAEPAEEETEAEPQNEEGVEAVENGKHVNGSAKSSKAKKAKPKAEKESKKAAPKAAAKAAKGKASATGKGRPKSGGPTLLSACELYNSFAEKAGLKVRKINTTGFSGKPDAAKALRRLRDGLKEAGVKLPAELPQYLSAFPEA